METDEAEARGREPIHPRHRKHRDGRSAHWQWNKSPPRRTRPVPVSRATSSGWRRASSWRTRCAQRALQ
eukprot:4014597-Prorocentrum_lima.AAC.1